MDSLMGRWFARSPVTAATFCIIVGPGGFILLAIMTAMHVAEVYKQDAEWWAKFRIEHNCIAQTILPGSAAFMDHENPKVAWNCDGEIYLRSPR